MTAAVRILHDFLMRVKRAAQAFESASSAAPVSGGRQFVVALQRDTLDGGWVAESLDLPGCVSQGDTEAEALENIADAIAEVLAARMGQQLPSSGGRSDSGSTRRVELSV